MEVLVVDAAGVAAALPMAECLEVMEEALADLARGEASMPLRQMAELAGGNLLASMPAMIRGGAAVKVITVYPGNAGTGVESHQGAVLLFEPERGSLVVIADAGAVTAIRTAAVSAVATRALAREDAGDLAILGSGTQARTHLEAMRAVRDVRRVRVWGRSPERARAFAERESSRHEIAVEVAGSVREAVEGADLVCTLTAASEPVLEGAWLSPGAHVNAVGYAGPNGRELDTEVVVRSRLFVDRRESALAESGDVTIPIREGAIGEDHIVAELGEVLVGSAPGRRSPDEITLFESLGLAVEDAAAVAHIHRVAGERGIGARVPFGEG